MTETKTTVIIKSAIAFPGGVCRLRSQVPILAQWQHDNYQFAAAIRLTPLACWPTLRHQRRTHIDIDPSLPDIVKEFIRALHASRQTISSGMIRPSSGRKKIAMVIDKRTRAYLACAYDIQETENRTWEGCADAQAILTYTRSLHNLPPSSSVTDADASPLKAYIRSLGHLAEHTCARHVARNLYPGAPAASTLKH